MERQLVGFTVQQLQLCLFATLQLPTTTAYMTLLYITPFSYHQPTMLSIKRICRCQNNIISIPQTRRSRVCVFNSWSAFIPHTSRGFETHPPKHLFVRYEFSNGGAFYLDDDYEIGLTLCQVLVPSLTRTKGCSRKGMEWRFNSVKEELDGVVKAFSFRNINGVNRSTD